MAGDQFGSESQSSLSLDQGPYSSDIPILDLLGELNLAAALINPEGRVIAMTEELSELTEFTAWRTGCPPRHCDSKDEERIKAYLGAILSEQSASRGSVPLLIGGKRCRPMVLKGIPIRQRPLNEPTTAAAVVIVIDLETNPAPTAGLLRYVF